MGHRFIVATQAPVGQPIWIRADQVVAVHSIDIRDYIPRDWKMHNAPPIAALGKRTLVVAEYDSFTVSETGDEIMNRLADALGGELYPNQLHRP